MGKPRVMQQTTSRTSPPLIQRLVMILPSFPRSFQLMHQNTYGTVERTPGNLLMPLPSLQLSFRAQNALIYSRPPSVRVQIPRMMLFTL